MTPSSGFQLEAVHQRRARIFELKHFRLLGDGQVEIALVPAFEVGELVVGRQEGMSFAVALDLGDFVDVLPTRAGLGVLAVDRLVGARLDHREHDAVREVAVVGDREHVAAGLLLVGRHPFPEIAGIVAAGRQRRIGHDLACKIAVVAEQHVAVEIVAAGVRRPFIADDGREAARLVGFFRGIDRIMPGGAIGVGTRIVKDRTLELTRAERGDDVDGGGGALARLDHVIPFAAQRVREKLRFPFQEIREEAHIVGVIGDDQEVERPRKFRELSGRGHDLLALGETVGVARTEPRAERPGIKRHACMDMSVAEERPRRKVAASIGRIRTLGGKHLLSRRLVERADIGVDGFLRPCGHGDG